MLFHLKKWNLHEFIFFSTIHARMAKHLSGKLQNTFDGFEELLSSAALLLSLILVFVL
jgi:hypothetical protein